MKKSLLIASLITASLAATPLMAEDRGYNKDCERGHKSRMHHDSFGFGGKMNRKEMFEREFNADQIRTLMEARLLMKGNDNLKVGQISKDGDGFTVAIVTQDNSLVDELELAANGMPRDKYERIKKHMEKRKQKHDS